MHRALGTAVHKESEEQLFFCEKEDEQRSRSKSEQDWLQMGQEGHFTPQRMILPQALVFLQ